MADYRGIAWMLEHDADSHATTRAPIRYFVLCEAIDGLRTLQRERDEALEALRPFAELGGEYRDHTGAHRDGDIVYQRDRVAITLGDLRRAAAILNKHGSES